jgi:hypothetical protein
MRRTRPLPPGRKFTDQARRLEVEQDAFLTVHIFKGGYR